MLSSFDFKQALRRKQSIMASGANADLVRAQAAKGLQDAQASESRLRSYQMGLPVALGSLQGQFGRGMQAQVGQPPETPGMGLGGGQPQPTQMVDPQAPLAGLGSGGFASRLTANRLGIGFLSD